MRSILLTALMLAPSLAFAQPADPAPNQADDEAPADEAPADEAPADEAPADEAPADEAPADEAPADEAPADEAPAEAAAVEEAPALDPAVAAAATADAAEPIAAMGGTPCTYTDLQGQFTVTVDCALLQDHTGNSQPHKRIWLGGAHSQFNIIEVPEPYRTVQLKEVMDALGRDWGSKKTPERAGDTKFAGIDAMAVTEHKQRTTSRTWLFNLNGRNVIANAVALGKNGKKRKAHLAMLTEALEAGFQLN